MKGFLVFALFLAVSPALHARQQAAADSATVDAATATAQVPAQATAGAPLPPPDDTQVDRLMAVMHARESIDGMLPRIEAMQRQMVAQSEIAKGMDEAQRAQMDAYLEKTSARIKEAMAWERLEPIMRDAYRKTFSRAEMDAMIRFYGSPEGQQIIAKTPLLMHNSMEAMQSLIGPMLAGLKKDLDEMQRAREP